MTYFQGFLSVYALTIDLMHNDVTRLDAREEYWS